MKKRNPIAVLLLPLITFGIYQWYWLVKTKGEMNRLGTVHVPTAWIWLIPVVGGIWWLWKYSEAVGNITKGAIPGILSFVLLWLLGSIGSAIIQDSFNKLNPGTATPGTDMPPAPVTPVENQQPPTAPNPPLVSG